MEINKQWLAGMLFSVLFLIGSTSFSFGASDEPLGNTWLNGKWEGRPPIGGVLTMTLTVEKDNQVQGKGLIRQANKPAHPQVTGTVNGNEVTLETFFPDAFSQSAVHYDCRLMNEVLQCRTKSGYKTVFKKVD